MPRPRLTVVFVVLSLAACCSLRAQTASAAAGLGAAIERTDNSFWQSFTRLQPATRLANAWFQLDGSATMTTTGRTMRFDDGTVDVLAETPSVNGYRISSVLHDERVSLGAGITRSIASYESALSYASRGSGASIGLGSERTNASASDATPNLRFGVWHQFKFITASLGASDHAMRIEGTPAKVEFFQNAKGFPDSVYIMGTAARVAHWSSLESRVDWSDGRLAARARVGLQSQPASSKRSVWNILSATYAMTEQVALTGSLGSDASRSAYGIPTSHFASLGIRVAPAALFRGPTLPHVRPTVSAFAVRPADAGLYVLTMRVPSARTVEVSGDFNGWTPVALRQVAPDEWQTTIAMKPGTYHVNARVNGDAWIAPPGLSSTLDEFNGTVGLLIIR